MVSFVDHWPICMVGNADIHVKYTLPINYWWQIWRNVSKQSDSDSILKLVWYIPYFPGFVPFVAPPLASYSLVYGWKQSDFGECWSSTATHAELYVIVVCKHIIFYHPQSHSFIWNKKNNGKTLQIKWYLSENVPPTKAE